MVVSTGQSNPDIGSFKFVIVSVYQNVNGKTMTKFLIIIFRYSLLLRKVLNTRFCLSKFATRLMFHWKVIIVLSLLDPCSLLLLHGDIDSNPGPRKSRN